MCVSVCLAPFKTLHLSLFRFLLSHGFLCDYLFDLSGDILILQGPQYVCINFWTFVCMRCSVIHRELTHRVKSVSVSKFTSDEIEALQKGGNQRAREMYMKYCGPRLPDCSDDELQGFIEGIYGDEKSPGGKNSEKPPSDLQSLDINIEKETRRGSSYHSFSQSPPYNFQYEKRKNRRHGDALTRKPGSDRGLYERKASSPAYNARYSPSYAPYSPSYSPYSPGPRAYEERSAKEGSNSRNSYDSMSSGGDQYRSSPQSPNSQKDYSGYSSHGDGDALTRKPGSDRGLYERKVSSPAYNSPSYAPYSPGPRAYEERSAKEGSNSRNSDDSMSSGGDQYRSSPQSPNSQKDDSGYSSPTMDPTRGIGYSVTHVKRDACASPHPQRSKSSPEFKRRYEGPAAKLTNLPYPGLGILDCESNGIAVFQAICDACPSDQLAFHDEEEGTSSPEFKLRYEGPDAPKLMNLPYPELGIIGCEANVLAAAQAIGDACPLDPLAFRDEEGNRDLGWMARYLQGNLMHIIAKTGQLLAFAKELERDRDAYQKRSRELEKENKELRHLIKEVMRERDAEREELRAADGRARKFKLQASSCSVALKKAKKRSRELEDLFAQLKLKIADCERQHSESEGDGAEEEHIADHSK
ncbi:hypothetical protein Dimus_029998 [Dionaea muscipula]